jgi:hypothetical protein
VSSRARVKELLETVFSALSVPRYCKVVTVTLRDVGGDEMGTQCLEYNWATLFLEDINTGTRASRLGKSRI